MMANPYRGEIALTVDGVPRVLRLSLGRLAALEAQLAELRMAQGSTEGGGQ